MTTARTIVLTAVLTLALPSAQAMAAADGWGASYSFNAVQPPDSNHLTYARTTLVPGRLPPITSTTGPLFIWPGLSNSKGDLIQTTMDAWQDNKGACGAAPGQWCVEASVFGSCGQCGGPSAAVDADDHITIEYKLESDNNTWTQTVTSQKLGKVVSTYSRASGPMLGNGFGFATEADADSYTIDTQYYLCTEFHLLKADPTWGPKSGGGNGAKYGATGTGSGPGTAKNLRTPDGGLTWLVDLITLPAMNPQGAQTPPPAYNCFGSGGTSGTAGAPGTGAMAATGGARTGGAPGTGGTRAATGGSPGAGGTMATGGRPGTGGNVNVATGGLPGIGGNSMTGGRPNTGGNNNGTTGGTPGTGGLVGSSGTGTGGAQANTGGKTSTGGNTTSATGGSNTLGGSGYSVGGSSQAKGGASALGGNSSASPISLDDTGGCSCSVPGKNTPRGLFALTLAGAALALRSCRRR